MNKRKTRIAAAATVLGLGGLAGIALSAGGQKASTLADKPLVRTKVIHRTVHVTKHLKPKRPAVAGSGAYGSSSYGGSAYGSATTGASSTGAGSYSTSAPISTGASGTASPTSGSGSSPVVTATSGASGAGGTGGEVDHEGGDGGGD